MNKSITKEWLDVLYKNNEKIFSKSYIKSVTFSKLIYDILKKSFPMYLNSILIFQLASQVADKIYNCPEIYDGYDYAQKRKVKFFIKNINRAILYLNKANDRIFRITKIIDEN